MILDVKTDVVQNTTTRRGFLRIALSEPDLYARDIHNRSVIAGARLPTEGLRIPSLSLRDFSLRQEQVNMLMTDRHRLRLVFQDFDAYAVRGLHEGLVQAVIVAWKHPHTRSLPLGDPLLDIVDDEADMVHHRALSTTLSFLGPEVQIDVDPGKHDQRVSTGHEQFAAHGKKQFFIRFHIFRNDVPVTHGHPNLVEWSGLRESGAGSQR